MAKEKKVAADFLKLLDRIPERQRMFEKIISRFDAIALFYGFEKIHLSMLGDRNFFNPFLKTGFLKKRAPIFCKTNNGFDFLLKFSGTLSILHAYFYHKMSDFSHPLKFSFEGPCFFTTDQGNSPRVSEEKGIITIGEDGPIAEAGVIYVLWRGFLENGLEVNELQLKINATGCSVCKPIFRSAFVSYFRSRSNRLCKNCRNDLKRDPIKILHCYEERCGILASHAPQVLDSLCDVCKKHLRGILEFLEEMHIPFSLDHSFFNEGLWFDTFVFKFSFVPRVLTAENESYIPHRTKHDEVVLGEGGRVSRVGTILAGKKLDVVSGTIFLDIFETILYKKGVLPPESTKPNVFVIQLGDLAKRKSFALMERLREAHIASGETLGRDSIKSQLKTAERIGAEFTIIIGQKEAIDGTIIIREVESGTQETIPQEKMTEFLKRKLKK